MHNKKGASQLPLRLTEVRPSTRMYRNRTWEHTPNGVYPQHPFPDIHLIGRFQLRANSGKYHFKTKIAKSVRFPKKKRASATEIMQWQEPARHGQPPQKRGARVRRCRVQGAGCGAKERRGADAGVSAGAKVHGVRRVSVQVRGRRRVSVQVQVQVQARARARGVGSEECRCGAQKSVAAGLRRASV